ncbi:proline-rich protein 36-like [Lepisosteus oculatus]|uniref:proline-rich protein 36-like n=1 Tax=Lepisosteus oculatus TaxID=7918 RepID=UPI0035F51986
MPLEPPLLPGAVPLPLPPPVLPPIARLAPPGPAWGSPVRRARREAEMSDERLLVVRHFIRPEGEIWGGDRAPPNTPELGYRNPVVSSCLPELVQKLERAAELQLELPGSPGSSRSGSPGSFRSVSPPSSPEIPLRSPPPAPPSGPLRPLPTPPRRPPFIPAMPLEPPLLPGVVPLPLPPPVLPPIARPLGLSPLLSDFSSVCRCPASPSLSQPVS